MGLIIKIINSVIVITTRIVPVTIVSVTIVFMTIFQEVKVQSAVL